ncbi:DNA internalization-related competence protein ComEC/Rec2 [Variovorax ginsengisoli]|nr:DNA internalization-related competence protein ComEC/Rec2 [Variovorax ginsengisoli]
MAGSVLGVALQLQQAMLWNWRCYAAIVTGGCILAGLSAWGVRRRVRVAGVWGLSVSVALLVGACLGVGLTGLRAVAYAGQTLDSRVEGRDVEVTGVIAQMPQHGEGGVRFRLNVQSAREVAPAGRGAPVALPSTLALAWYATRSGGWGRAGEAAAQIDPMDDAPATLHAGERWRFTVRLKAPHGALNPHGFDHELSMWEQGVQAMGSVRTGARDAPPERLGATWRHPVERVRETVRDAVFAQVADRRMAGVIAALVTGDQGAIERNDWDVFRATGVAHLMSISGLHVTMFAWLASAVVGMLWRRSSRLMLAWPAPHAAVVGGVLLAALYALFSGWGIPSQRTVWMLLVVGLLRLSGRRWPWPFVWLAACWTVVVADPWALMQPGFWLSFVAVGALFATDAGAAPIGGGTAASRARHMLREQWVVTLALTPLTLLLFQQISAVGLLANAVAIPWITLVVTPLAMLGAVVPALWTLAGWAVQALSLVLGWLASWPFATLSMPAPPLWAAVAGIAGGVWMTMRLPAALRLLGLPLLLPVLLWQVPRPAEGSFDLLAADVGQGNAVLVRTAHHSLLYDAGPRYGLESDAGNRVLVPLLAALGERLDMLVLSHRDVDHIGGAEAVLATQPQAALLSSIEASHPLQALRPAQPCVAGQQWRWDGVTFEVLHPRADDIAFLSKPNTLSCVLRIHAGTNAVLLAGDIERLQELALVTRTSALGADLLLVPHHGSKTSSSDALLDAVAPRIALVQAGYRNRFGHPAPEVVDRYRLRDIALVESTRCGAAFWTSMRPGDLQCHRQQARRYWHHAVPPMDAD